MSCLCMHMPKKKLKQLSSYTEKAWKSLASSLPSQLRSLNNHLKLPKSVTKTTRRLLNLRHKSRPFLRQSRGQGRFYSNKQYRQYHHLQHSASNSPASIYVDRLYSHTTSSEAKFGINMEPSTSGANTSTKSGGDETNVHNVNFVKKRNEKVVRNYDKNNKGEVKWKDYVASLPNIRGVDERAEDFISKFRQQMQLQREQSIVEFHEMLARSA